MLQKLGEHVKHLLQHNEGKLAAKSKKLSLKMYLNILVNHTL